MEHRDHYEVLGRCRESTYKELKSAYHARLLLLHPDKSVTTEEDVREFHRIREAWRVLGDPISRRKYDAARRQEELEGGGDDVVYARITPSELQESSVKDTLFFHCRCGDRYLVERADLLENSLLEVTCEGCTLVILIKTQT